MVLPGNVRLFTAAVEITDPGQVEAQRGIVGKLLDVAGEEGDHSLPPLGLTDILCRPLNHGHIGRSRSPMLAIHPKRQSVSLIL